MIKNDILIGYVKEGGLNKLMMNLKLQSLNFLIIRLKVLCK